MFVMNPKCLLCGDGSRHHQLRSRKQSDMLEEWGRRLAVSLCQMLELDQTFEHIFADGPFCSQCQETVCNAEFTLNSISRLQCQLGSIIGNIKGILLSNYQGSTATEYQDPDSSDYNQTLERIVSSMGTMTKVEPGPSEGSENVAALNYEEFMLPTLTTTLASHQPHRLEALKKRQKGKVRPKSSSRELTKPTNLSAKGESSVVSEASVTPPPGDAIAYSRSGRKIKPVFKISEDIFEDHVSSGDDDDGMDTGSPDGEFAGHDAQTSEESASVSASESESEFEEENDEILEKPAVPVKVAKKRIRGPRVRVRPSTRPMPTEFKFTCNFEACVGQKLKFPFPRDVKTHIQTVHRGEGLDTPYHCPHCPHRAKNNEKLRRHGLIHKEHRARYPCPTCGKEFLNRRGMKHHHENCSGSSGSGKIQCKFCKKPFQTMEELSAHVGLHSATNPFDCVLCETKLKNKDQLIYHVKSIHEGIRRRRKYEEGIGPFPCNFPPCSQHESKFMEVEDMKRHLAEVHGQLGLAVDLIYHCIQCDDRFMHNRILQRHLTKRHEAPQELPKENLCSLCGKLFLSKPTLRQHLREFHNALRMKPKCSLCTKSCESPEDLQAHEQLHSPHTPYACVLCPATLITTIDLHAHVYNTHEVFPFRCDVGGCGKGFETKLRLDYHMKTVHGPNEKPHVCPYCPFSSWGPVSLKEHIRSHTQEKSFVCETTGCGRAFVWKSQLWRHVREKHGGPVTMIPCKVCGKEFMNKGLMKRHEVHHSDARPFECQLCSASFKVARHLKRHMKTHDKGGGVGMKGEGWKPRRSRLVTPTPTPLPTPNHNFMPQFF